MQRSSLSESKQNLTNEALIEKIIEVFTQVYDLGIKFDSPTMQRKRSFYPSNNPMVEKSHSKSVKEPVSKVTNEIELLKELTQLLYICYRKSIELPSNMTAANLISIFKAFPASLSQFSYNPLILEKLYLSDSNDWQTYYQSLQDIENDITLNLYEYESQSHIPIEIRSLQSILKEIYLEQEIEDKNLSKIKILLIDKDLGQFKSIFETHLSEIKKLQLQFLSLTSNIKSMERQLIKIQKALPTLQIKGTSIEELKAYVNEFDTIISEKHPETISALIPPCALINYQDTIRQFISCLENYPTQIKEQNESVPLAEDKITEAESNLKDFIITWLLKLQDSNPENGRAKALLTKFIDQLENISLAINKKHMHQLRRRLQTLDNSHNKIERDIAIENSKKTRKSLFFTQSYNDLSSLRDGKKSKGLSQRNLSENIGKITP